MPSPDVAILGAGPAGSIAAVLLARAGAWVVLVGTPVPGERIEGVSPRVVRILSDHGLVPDGLSGPARRQVRWGAMDATPNLEHVVERQRFDASLVAAAREAGVQVVEARIGRVSRGLAETSAGPVRAGILVEARGRRGPAAQGRRRGPATVAIAGWAGSESAEDGAALAATPAGWHWSASLGGRRWTQIVIDGDAADAGRDGLQRAWASVATAAGAGFPALPAQPVVRAAELRLTAPELDPQCPRLGDAAVAIDPLSGHGIFWAMSSALMAPPLLRAIAEGKAELAARFYRDRVAATFWRQARIGRDFYRLVDDWPDAPFWAARRAWPDDAPAHAHVPAPERARRVVVQDGRLAEAEVLLTPQEPDGVAFVFGQAIVAILDRAGPGPLPGRDRFPPLLPEIPPATAMRIHDWLVSRGVAAAPSRGQDEKLEVLT